MIDMNLYFLKTKTEELAALCAAEVNNGVSVVITGHDMPDSDSIISAVMLKELLARLGVTVTVKFGTCPDGVTARDARTLDLLNEIGFDGFDDDDRLVLVDHHVTFYNNEVIGCVDHHTTPPEPDFAFSLIESSSSCGRIIYDMARSVGVCDDWFEKMSVYSVYLDTQSCRSPKFNKSDEPWLADAIVRLDLDENELVRMGFCLMSPDESAGELAMYGYKRYEYNGKKTASTCIQIDPDDLRWQSLIPDVIDHVRARCRADSCLLWAFVVNMPSLTRSDIYFVSENGVDKTVSLDRLASRSRDVVPVMKAI